MLNGRIKKTKLTTMEKSFFSHREWAAHMSVVYLLHQLVENYTSNMDLFENVDWVVVPVVNPDGM